jgi:hypothetical protein
LGFDVNFMRKTKCLRIAAKHGILGRVLCYDMLTWIAEFDACYAEWSEDSPVLFAQSVLYDITLAEEVQKVVETMLDVGFFDRSAFERDRILTSRGIVKRWMGVITKTGRKVNYQLLPPSVVEFIEQGQEDGEPTSSNHSHDSGRNGPLLPQKEEKVPRSTPLLPQNGVKSGDFFPIESKRKETKVNIPPNPPCGGDARKDEIRGHEGELIHPARGAPRERASVPPETEMPPDGLTSEQREVVNAWNECFPRGDPRHLNGPPYPLSAMFFESLRESFAEGFTLEQVRDAFRQLRSQQEFSWQLHAAVRPGNLRILLTEIHFQQNQCRARDRPGEEERHSDPTNYPRQFFSVCQVGEVVA